MTKEEEAYNLLVRVPWAKGDAESRVLFSAIQTAIDALRMQVAVAPVNVVQKCSGKVFNVYRVCPSCGQYTDDHYKAEYCEWCGQHLLWEDEE